jgi:predicted nucleic acid-binding protein
MELSVASICSAYDCEFIALAKDLNIPLVTVNRQVQAQFPKTVVSLEEYVVA